MLMKLLLSHQILVGFKYHLFPDCVVILVRKIIVSFAISEPTLVSNHTSVDPAAPSLEEDTVQAEETSHPLDNGKISTPDEVVSSPSVGTQQNDVPPVSSNTVQTDASSVPKAIVSDVQEDLPKKSYASVVSSFT